MLMLYRSILIDTLEQRFDIPLVEPSSTSQSRENYHKNTRRRCQNFGGCEDRH